MFLGIFFLPQEKCTLQKRMYFSIVGSSLSHCVFYHLRVVQKKAPGGGPTNENSNPDPDCSPKKVFRKVHWLAKLNSVCETSFFQQAHVQLVILVHMRFSVIVQFTIRHPSFHSMCRFTRTLHLATSSHTQKSKENCEIDTTTTITHTRTSSPSSHANTHTWLASFHRESVPWRGTWLPLESHSYSRRLHMFEFLHIDIQSIRADITLCGVWWVWRVVPWCVEGKREWEGKRIF